MLHQADTLRWLQIRRPSLVCCCRVIQLLLTAGKGEGCFSSRPWADWHCFQITHMFSCHSHMDYHCTQITQLSCCHACTDYHCTQITHTCKRSLKSDYTVVLFHSCKDSHRIQITPMFCCHTWTDYHCVQITPMLCFFIRANDHYTDVLFSYMCRLSLHLDDTTVQFFIQIKYRCNIVFIHVKIVTVFCWRSD